MMNFSLAKITNNANQVAQRIERRKVEMLDQFGRDMAEEAKAIQKDSPRPSAPGRPPNVHSPPPNLETFAHVIDRAEGSVLAGPVYIPGSATTPALPGAINRGGRVIQRRRLRSGRQVTRVRYIKARPFVVPAAKRAIIKLQTNARRGF